MSLERNTVCIFSVQFSQFHHFDDFWLSKLLTLQSAVRSRCLLFTRNSAVISLGGLTSLASLYCWCSSLTRSLVVTIWEKGRKGEKRAVLDRFPWKKRELEEICQFVWHKCLTCLKLRTKEWLFKRKKWSANSKENFQSVSCTEIFLPQEIKHANLLLPHWQILFHSLQAVKVFLVLKYLEMPHFINLSVDVAHYKSNKAIFTQNKQQKPAWDSVFVVFWLVIKVDSATDKGFSTVSICWHCFHHNFQVSEFNFGDAVTPGSAV